MRIFFTFLRGNLFYAGTFLFLSQLLPHSVKAQQIPKDIVNLINTAVYKNLVAYNIRYASSSFNGIYVPKHIRSNTDLFYRFMIPDYGYRMKMSIQSLNSLSYPDSSFILYKITTNGFDFVSDHGGPEIGSSGPILNNLYLIALKPGTDEIKFISGEFFNSEVIEDFKMDIKNPSSLLQYLQFRFFDVNPANITFNRQNKVSLFYSGYSEKYKSNFTIEIPKSDVDHPHIIICRKGTSGQLTLLKKNDSHFSNVE